jgi:hypothetical protein
MLDVDTITGVDYIRVREIFRLLIIQTTRPIDTLMSEWRSIHTGTVVFGGQRNECRGSVYGYQII